VYNQLDRGIMVVVLLGISRRAFLDLLGRYGVSIFDEQIDFVAESQHGRA